MRRCGFIVIVRSSPWACGPGSSPDRGLCVLFLGWTLYSHSASLHPGVQMGTCARNAGGYQAMDQQPVQGNYSQSRHHATETVV